MKKGQATMFVILAIILIAAIILSFTLREQFIEQFSEVQPVRSAALQEEVDDVTALVETCMESSGKEAAYSVLGNGGFLSLDKSNSVDVYARLVPIYYNYGQQNVPTKEDMEANVGEYASYLMQYCLLDLSNENFKVEQTGDIELEATIDEGVDFDLALPLTIYKDNDSARIESFSQHVDVDMMTPYSQALEAYQFIRTSPTESELSEFISDKQYMFASERIGDADVYALKFESMPIEDVDIDDEFVVFTFGIKERLEEINPEEISDETLSYILTFPELFDSEDVLVDEFEEPDLEDIIDLDNEEEFGGFDVS